jgi:TPR repeat protein
VTNVSAPECHGVSGLDSGHEPIGGGYQRAADAGEPLAMINLGNLLRTADPPDLEGARHWYQRAADAGQPLAMINLGNLLRTR